MNGLIYFEYFTELARHHFNIVFVCMLVAAAPGAIMLIQIQQRKINNYTLYWHGLELRQKILWYLGFLALMAVLGFGVNVAARKGYAEDIRMQCRWDCSSTQEWKLKRLGASESEREYQPLIIR